MSALTEQVAREHDYFDTPKGRQCRCGARPPRGVEMIAWHREHVAEVTEAATRAAVAAEIRARIGSPVELADVFIGVGLERAATIAEGKEPKK